MKRLIASLVIATASTVALAGTGPGCGVGSMIFKGQSGIAPHVLAATTNGSFGNQTIGMTFGSLGCDANKPITSLAIFMNSNLDNVAMDMSRGAGENMNTLAVLLKIKKSDRTAFNLLMKQHFVSIFPTDKTTSDQALNAIEATLKTNPRFAKYVS